jgi:3-oxoacyl-[acyl-carrier protein] reductase
MEKYALVTGSSRGIGKAIALQLASDGYDILLHCRQQLDEVKAVQSEIEVLGRKAYIFQADLSKENEVEAMFQSIPKVTEKLDLLVNNAGFDYGYLFEDYTLAQMREVLDIVLWAKVMVTKLALPLLKKSEKAQIINIASRMGREKTIKTIAIYGPAMAGVMKFTQCMALELADYKIRVNCVAPGLTRTDLTERMFIRDEGSAKAAEQLWQELANKNPSKRVGMPEDVANLVSFVASDKAQYINGEILSVNGGSNLI